MKTRRKNNKKNKPKTTSHLDTTPVSSADAMAILKQASPELTIFQAVDEEQMADLIRARQSIDHVILTPKNPKTTLSVKLMGAAYHGLHDEVKMLLQQGADPNYWLNDNNGNTPLITAAECYHARTAQQPEKREQFNQHYRLIVWLLHQHGADINQCNQLNRSPLSVAAEVGDLAMVTLLVKLGATIDQVDSCNHLTALGTAAANNHLAVMTYLIERGACVNAVNANARSPIYLAAHKGHVDAVRLLLQHGANPDEYTVKMHSPTLPLATSHGNEAVITLLLEAGANPNQTLDGGDSALILAVDDRRVAIARRLLEHGANVDMLAGKMHISALFLAAQKNDIEMVKLLIEFKANVNLHSKSTGTSALHVALYNDCLEVATYLVEHGANIDDRRDEDGATPLSLAIVGGKPKSIAFALQHGADIDIVVNNNSQALVFALAKKDYSPDITRILIQHILKASSIESSCLSNVTARLCQSGNAAAVLLLIDALLAQNVSGIAILNLLPIVASSEKTNAMNNPEIQAIIDLMRKQYLPNVRFINLENQASSPPQVENIDQAVSEVVKKISLLSLSFFQQKSKDLNEKTVLRKRI